MAEKRSGTRRQTTRAAEKRGTSRKATSGRTEKGAAEKDGGNSRKATTGRTEKGAAEKDRGNRKETASRTEGSRNGITAPDAVSRARGALGALLGLPVEGVLGIDRDGANWVATVQVLELARIPNTTDVIGEYETVLDGHGEVIRYHRTRRYHRGQVEGGQQ